MKRLFKRSATVLLVLVLIFSMTAMSVSAFTPPGQLRKAERAGELEQQQHQWRIFNEEGLAQFFRLMPEGIRGKFIPPGLLDKGGLPPGIQQVFGTDPENWPPGIRMRFGDAIDWNDGRWNEREKREVTEVWNRDDLEDAIDEKAEEIKLMRDITIFEALLIDWDLYLDGNGFELGTTSPFDDDWMIEVIDDAHLRVRKLTINGYNESGLEGLIKVEEDATLTAVDNELYDAPIGIAFWLDVDLDDLDDDDLEELLEELEEKADDLEDNNKFDDVDEPVVYYDENDNMIYPEE
ncbi:MAG: hypothetical protein SCK57_07430 [Bacillota bacterium]|nr:hypothetical protein [Bacillota bacterium]MDW7677477.1 hypothetical protein [Bacillota bacterium]